MASLHSRVALERSLRVAGVQREEMVRQAGEVNVDVCVDHEMGENLQDLLIGRTLLWDGVPAPQQQLVPGGEDDK